MSARQESKETKLLEICELVRKWFVIEGEGVISGNFYVYEVNCNGDKLNGDFYRSVYKRVKSLAIKYAEGGNATSLMALFQCVHNNFKKYNHLP